LLSGLGGALVYRHFDKDPAPSTVEFNFSGNVTQITPAPIKLVVNGRVIVRDSLVHDTILLPVISPVDTAAILADYYATRFYDDKLVDNDSITIRLREELTQNRITFRSLDYSIHASTEIPQQRNKYIIMGVGWHDSAPMISAGVLYQNTTKSLIGAEIGYNHSLFIQAKYGFKF
jgi:hypothetical protein